MTIGFVLSSGKICFSQENNLKLTDDGEWIEKFSGEVEPWGTYLRYNYARFDFSSVSEPGIYIIKSGT
jgi:hypothetical protein